MIKIQEIWKRQLAAVATRYRQLKILCLHVNICMTLCSVLLIHLNIVHIQGTRNIFIHYELISGRHICANLPVCHFPI